MAAGPSVGEFVFKAREAQIARHQAQPGREHFDMGLGNVTDTTQDGGDGPIHSMGVVSIGPQCFKPFFVQKHGGEVGLWIQVHGQHFDSTFSEHPGQVVDKRSFADTALVVEKGNTFQVDLLRMVTRKILSSMSNSAGGLPLATRSSCAR